MKFQISDLKHFSAAMLESLNVLGIHSYDDIVGKVGLRRPLGGFDFLHITDSPSSFGGLAYNISFVRPKSGVPLEVKIKTRIGPTDIYVKAQQQIQGYMPFSVDAFDNWMQTKFIPSSDLYTIREELQRLSELRVNEN